jgi:acetyl-CoA synthetase
MVDIQQTQEMAWVPGDAVRERSRLLAAMRNWGLSKDVAELNRRAIADPEWFWRAAVADLGVDFAVPFERVIDESAGKPFPRGFPAAGSTWRSSPRSAMRVACWPRRPRWCTRATQASGAH